MSSKLPYAKCETCPLRENKQIHFDIKEKTDFAFMGMHGGVEEIRAGKVFVGQSGKIVRQVPEQLGFKNVSYLNAVACAPDSSETVNEQARQHCEPAIINLITNKIKPKMLFSMGPESLRTSGVLPSPKSYSAEKAFKITQNNGFIESSEKLNNIPVMMLIHPAFFLHQIEGSRESNADKFGDWVNALHYGVKNYFDPIPKPQVKLIKTISQLKELISKTTTSSKVAVDIESKSLKLFEKILCISITIEKEPNIGYIIPIPDDITPYYDSEEDTWKIRYPEKRKELLDLLKEFLETRKIIMHGAMFDAPYFESYGIRIRVYSDTLLKLHLVDESAFSHGLKYQARTKLSWPEWDRVLHRFVPSEEKQREDISKAKKKPADWSLIPKHMLYRYAGWDSPATYHLDVIGEKELDQLEKDLYYNEIIPTLNMYTHLRFTGVAIDPVKFGELKEKFEAKSLELYEQLHSTALDYGLVAFNPKSPKQKADLLFNKMGFGVIEKSARTGEPSTDKKKVLERLPINEVTPKLIAFQNLETDISRYIWGVIKFTYPDFGIHPYYNLTLKTGRMSATNPSVLNIKKGSELRSGYIPHRKGKRIVFEGDQSQCELRVLTGATNSQQMFNAFAIGFDVELEDGTIGKSKDIHSYFSKLINPSLSLEEIEKGGFRTRTKNVVFGKVYRASIYVMADQMMMSALQEIKKTDIDRFNSIAINSSEFAKFYMGLLEQAEFISNKIDDFCPELKDYEERCISELHKKGYTTSLTGRKRHIPLITYANKKHAENQACNSPIQDTANVINWHAMRKVYEKYQEPYERKGKIPPIFLWFSVHDSIVGDIDTNLGKDSVEEILMGIKDIGENAAASMLGDRYPIFNEIPFKVDLKIGTNLGNTEDLEKIDLEELLTI